MDVRDLLIQQAGHCLDVYQSYTGSSWTHTHQHKRSTRTNAHRHAFSLRQTHINVGRCCNSPCTCTRCVHVQMHALKATHPLTHILCTQACDRHNRLQICANTYFQVHSLPALTILHSDLTSLHISASIDLQELLKCFCPLLHSRLPQGREAILYQRVQCLFLGDDSVFYEPG